MSKSKLRKKQQLKRLLSDLQETLKGEDKDEIEAKTTALTELSGKLAERVYAQKAETGDVETADSATESDPADDVVDAEFEEVKDEDDTK